MNLKETGTETEHSSILVTIVHLVDTTVAAKQHAGQVWPLTWGTAAQSRGPSRLSELVSCRPLQSLRVKRVPSRSPGHDW